MKKFLVFLFVWFLLEGVGFSFNPNGVWYEELWGDDFEVEAVDVFYLEGEKLYIIGSHKCNTVDHSNVLNQVGEKIFRAESLQCSIRDISVFYQYFEITFHNDHSASLEAKAVFKGHTLEIHGTAQKFPPTPLSSGEEITISGEKDNIKVFSIDVPEGTSRLEVKTWGGWGDCDLYVGRMHPTVFLESDDEYTEEEIIVSCPVPGRWYIGLEGIEAYENVKLKAILFSGYNYQCPPQETKVGMCTGVCRTNPPVKISQGRISAGFSYNVPVTVLVGVLSEDLQEIRWLNDNYQFGTNFSLFMNRKQNHQCQGVSSPFNHGWIFWLVTKENLVTLKWQSDPYELLFYNF